MHYLTNNVEVFPFPFCGKPSYPNMVWKDETNLLVEGWVECGTCEARSLTVFSSKELEDTINIWNKCSEVSAKLSKKKRKTLEKRKTDQLLLEFECLKLSS